MEYVVVVRRDNVYSTARLDSCESAYRLVEALQERGFETRLLSRPA